MDDFLNYAENIFRKRQQERNLDSAVPALSVDSNLEKEEFRISQGRITAGSKLGILFGIGKYLRTRGKWEGSSKPEKPVRISYFATHFHSFYDSASLETLREYMEDQALLGYNAVGMRIPVSEYPKGSPEIVEKAKKLDLLFDHARKLGMETQLWVICNEGFQDTPQAVNATRTGYGWAGCEVCPSVPGGLELILDNHRMICTWFKHLDQVLFWSYDEGGCGCEKCAPYGSNGMFRCAREAAKVYRGFFPDIKVIYSTWVFDHLQEKMVQWEGFYHRLENGEGEWIDYVLSDNHFDRYPAFPREHWDNRKRSQKLINFPEMSMWGRHPWGGFGATMFPERLKKLWGQVNDLVAGGMPYCEGKFEDVNKAVYASFYWTGTTDYFQALDEYARYELGIEDTGKFRQLIKALEDNHYGVVWSNHQRHWQKPKNCPGWRPMKRKPQVYTDLDFVYQHPELAWSLVQQLEKDMSEPYKKCWRWRLIHLRARLDLVLSETHNEANEETERIMEELCRIYEIDPDHAYSATCPFTDRFLNSKNKYHNDSVAG